MTRYAWLHGKLLQVESHYPYLITMCHQGGEFPGSNPERIITSTV